MSAGVCTICERAVLKRDVYSRCHTCRAALKTANDAPVLTLVKAPKLAEVKQRALKECVYCTAKTSTWVRDKDGDPVCADECRRGGSR